MTKYIVTIEEHITKDFVIKGAKDMEEAMEFAKEFYDEGDFVLDGDSQVQTKLMSVYDPVKEEQTEWVEF